jgi:membrane-associated phospholipid phosphatase
MIEGMGAILRSVTAAAALACALLPRTSPAHAEDRVKPVDRRTHLGVTVGLGLAYVAGEFAVKDALSPDACRWCASNGLDDAVRDALVWDDTGLAHTLSNTTGYVGAPVWAFGGTLLAAQLDGHGARHWLDDSLIIAESALMASVLNYTIKSVFGRERPFVHQLADADKPLTDHPQENNLSFNSGHAALSMSLAVSAGTVAHLRGYRHAPHLTGVGITLALATGYFRSAADKHWFTDISTGWLLGAAFGYGVPVLLHEGRAGGVEIMPAVSGSTVGVAGRW